MADLAAHPDRPTPVPGPHRAVVETPEPAPGSVRRTTSIDMTRPEGFGGPLVADIRGRDLRRHADGELDTIDEIELWVRIDFGAWEILGIGGASATDEVAALEGTSLRRGYGAAVVAALPAEADARTLLYSALEDLNGANLVSGYALLREGILTMSPEEGSARAELQADICAGWARGGAVVERLRLTGTNAVPRGPEAPDLATVEGRWHELPLLDAGTVRRLRCLDVRRPRTGEDRPVVRAHFRDSYQSADDESVMHEYVVTAELDRADMTIGHLEVDVRVLPWDTCPAAAASAPTLDGTPVRDLPGRVRAELVGPSTCTHLNSTVRSLADVGALMAALEADDPTDPPNHPA